MTAENKLPKEKLNISSQIIYGLNCWCL